VLFNNSGKERTLRVPQSDTALEDSLRATVLYGAGAIQINGKELQITAPAQSVVIFSLD